MLDGYSRLVVHWDFQERMTEADVELILQRAREAFPGTRPKVISDNGSQFIAGDFKRFIDLTGMTHARTSVGYPQSNGKIERFHRILLEERASIRPWTSENQRRHGDARFIHFSNHHRSHGALGWATPTATSPPSGQPPRGAQLAAALGAVQIVIAAPVGDREG